ncbi:PIG-L deacetylase family protein [Trueperella bialowiezensis]|uniref:Glucosamine-6-phosphate deaminase-like protein n=1 Tax=Trueperella bialowiezensis TaxID=312285 RepID=A0A448PDL6_9ACTO|nr:PIG-L deacetylase family protein [Trueperella bialowiezensis]VEI13005.1 glucosamine-6-phosphate deaminase-like protein [Trueperella bialowiezensis]
METIHWGLAALLAAVAIVSVAAESALRRKLTNYRPTQILAAFAGILLTPANVWAAMGNVSPTVSKLIIAGSAAAVLAVIALYFVFSIRRTETTLPRRILAIGAHPDDLELAVGGTLARLADSGHEIHSIVMTAGKVGGDPAIRREEAKNGSKFLGVKHVDVHDFTDTDLESDMNEMIQVIERKIRSFNPDIIFTHSKHDQHQDHHAVHMATVRAGRRHPAILCFESPSVTLDFSPKVFVDIDDYVGVKASAVAIHENQAGKPYMTEERVTGMAHFRGDQAKMTHAEGFEPVRFDAFKGTF